MYGMLLESVQHFVQTEFGEHVWNQALQASQCKHTSFKTHQVYPDNLMPDLAQSLSAITGKSFDYFMNYFGKCFVRFFSNFGYDKIIRASGRYFADFLQSMDNLHNQMRFTYPKMKSPSMQLAMADENGAVLIYKSGRTGFSRYFMGQLTEIAKCFYDLDLKITTLESENDVAGGTTGPIQMKPLADQQVVVKYRLDFDNKEFMEKRINYIPHESQKSLKDLDVKILLELFPFTIVLDHTMNITDAGEKVLETFILHNPDRKPTSFIGSHIMENFKCRRPRGTIFDWDTIFQMRTVLFELELIRTGTTKIRNPDEFLDNEHNDETVLEIQKVVIEAEEPDDGERKNSQGLKSILLKGQMFFIKDLDSMVFLCSPLINNLDELHGIGLYLNDLNPHGLSRELVLAGWQHYSKLEIMFEKEEQRSDELEKSVELADSWKKKGDELLYSMLPRPIAERMRAGTDLLETCETFEGVSVIFGEVMGLHSGENIQEAMNAVTTLNAVFTAIDEEIFTPFVYKVETVGMVYMAVSGAPDINPLHAEHAADLALRLIKKIKNLKLKDVSVKIGIHSGPVVAGVVGLKVPRYCLFGDTVNTASRMESSGEAFKIQISSATAAKLQDRGYKLESRGFVKVKGKGEMETFWLVAGPED
ncbi:soluble guanylate cyclase 89Db-like [Condylostylus longicornis]|uniref:soluble guanylate cyclase 89Db-like n=1 Tax=Condylostylus longicornis TaxID=2530218 RepID=UPI00244DAB23|nr:soluble guanylate cyclase 89Db-like [Condylostylus longicornis]XP_055371680.1 soluble guanylate cyclase 89Db-like [Condylostylus longicornis]